MDIVDILLARAMTPEMTILQAEASALAAQEAAAKAVSDGEKAVSDANNALGVAEGITSSLSSALNDLEGVADTEIAKITLGKGTTSYGNAVHTNITAHFPGGQIAAANDVAKYYLTTGQKNDGAMTQKAVTDAIDSVSSSVNTLSNSVDTINNNIITINNNIHTLQSDVTDLKNRPSGGGSTNLGEENRGKVVVVGSDGNIIASDINEEELINALIKTDTYTARDAVGIQADYENRSYSRVQEASDYSQGADFNKYSMYGGRMRCNVNDNGEIVAWYGDSNYKEDGSNGQVMVYQPKFYYSRTFNKTAYNGLGDVIQKETLIISPTEQTGFKLHPLFKAADGSTLDYVLLSAYEGSAYTNSYDLNDSGNIDFSTAKLSSIAGAKPISGVNKQFTVTNAEQMAQNRGSGWHITNMAMESAQQMLQMVEYGNPNSQASLETGICYIPNNGSKNCASITGSTTSLGNNTGAAASTVNEINGNYNTYSDPGKRAVSYRGFENPWGNIWRMVGGVNIVGSSHQNGGIPRICTDYNYSTAADATNYESIGFQLPNTYDWVSGFGMPTSKYDWIYMPIECSGGNSAVPVGDNFWSTSNLNGVNLLGAGGLWYFELNDGMFYYSADQTVTTYARSYGARLMYIPEKNTAYYNNIAAWEQEWAGENQ